MNEVFNVVRNLKFREFYLPTPSILIPPFVIHSSKIHFKIMKFFNTPFSYFGLFLIGKGIHIIVTDLTSPSKMTPLGLYIGVIMILSILITKVISYFIYKAWDKSHYAFMGIEILLFFVVSSILVFLALKI